MTKRLRTARVAKRGRRLHAPGERLSNPGVRDSLTSAPDSGDEARDSLEPRDSGEVGDRASEPVTETPPPVVATASAVPGSIPPPARASEPPAVASARVSEPPARRSVPPVEAKASEPPVAAARSSHDAIVDSRATTKNGSSSPGTSGAGALTTAAVVAVAESTKKSKKSKVKTLKEPDARSDSGALSLNDAVTRSFYDAPIVAHHDEHDDEHEHESDTARPVAITPELLERKAKLRRIVGGICAAAALVVVLVAGKTVLDRDQPAAPTNAAVLEPRAPAADEAAIAREKAAAEARAAEEAKNAAAARAAAEAKAAEQAKADEAKPEEPKADEAKPEEPAAAGAPKSKEEIADLKKKASKLYNSGKLKEAIPALREAIAADPTDALPYLFLGDALTNSGNWKEARAAYDDCATNATKGPKHECVAMGGRKAKK